MPFSMRLRDEIRGEIYSFEVCARELRVELSQFTQLDTLKCKIAVNFTPKSI
jgi:hypothetical protein